MELTYFILVINFFTEDAGGDLKHDFLQEIHLMKKVAQGCNPFVVNMIGCCTTEEPLALIMEFVSGGNLLEFLKSHRRKVCIHSTLCMLKYKMFHINLLCPVAITTKYI